LITAVIYGPDRDDYAPEFSLCYGVIPALPVAMFKSLSDLVVEIFHRRQDLRQQVEIVFAFNRVHFSSFL
jgi:hypothetical protein